VFAIHDSPLYYEISDDRPHNTEPRTCTVTIEIIDTDCVLLSFLSKFFSAKWRIYKGILAPRLPSDKEFRAFKQSRSPSLRSSGRNARLWDNPLPEARNPGKIELRVPFQRPIRFLPETDYPRASSSFPRIAGSGNEIGV
jgi:hypothetical protein